MFIRIYMYTCFHDVFKVGMMVISSSKLEFAVSSSDKESSRQQTTLFVRAVFFLHNDTIIGREFRCVCVINDPTIIIITAHQIFVESSRTSQTLYRDCLQIPPFNKADVQRNERKYSCCVYYIWFDICVTRELHYIDTDIPTFSRSPIVSFCTRV